MDGHPEDEQIRWIARGLGQPLEALEQVRADPRAGEDAGQVFYQIALNGVDLAIRQDGMRAYLSRVEAGAAEAEQVENLLRGCHLQELEVPAFKTIRRSSLRKNSKARVHHLSGWIRVAEGRPPAPGRLEQVEYLHPARPGHKLPAGTLSSLSARLLELLKAEKLDAEALQQIHALAAIPGEVVARALPPQEGQPGCDVFGRELPLSTIAAELPPEPGAHVKKDTRGEYRARRYGYLCLEENHLSVLSPLWLDSENMRACWLHLDPAPQPLKAEMVHQCLADRGVVEGIDAGKIDKLCRRIRRGVRACGCFPIAAGIPPIHGEDGQVEFLVEVERRAGRVREDGSMDFHEVNFVPSVRAGQQVAHRLPPIPGTPGKDVKGQAVEARDGKQHLLGAGENLEVHPGEGGAEEFFATTNGVVRQRRGELIVAELLTLNEDVSFNTGNLDFSGEIYIDGSIVRGFAVRAGGDITITGTVEDGATVASQGDITVGQGIVGHRTRVEARGRVCAQFVQDSKVVAGGDIAVGNYVHHAYLRAGGSITVSRGKGTRGGSITGGQTWVHRSVDLHLAGLAGRNRHRPGSRPGAGAGREARPAEKLHKYQPGAHPADP